MCHGCSISLCTCETPTVCQSTCRLKAPLVHWHSHTPGVGLSLLPLYCQPIRRVQVFHSVWEGGCFTRPWVGDRDADRITSGSMNLHLTDTLFILQCISLPVTNFHASLTLLFQRATSLLGEYLGNLVLNGWWLIYVKFVILISSQCYQLSGSFWYSINICFVHSQSSHIVCCYPSHFAKRQLFRLPHRQEEKNLAGLDTL